MAQPSVVVAFTSQCGTTETLAHAAAVGVVNSRALPRLRRLVDAGLETTPDCTATLQRMRKEYVPPTETDIVGTPALIIVPSAGMTPTSAAWQSFTAVLERLASSGALSGKLGAVIDAGDHETVAAFSALLTARGFVLVPAEGADARGHGRAVGKALPRQ